MKRSGAFFLVFILSFVQTGATLAVNPNIIDPEITDTERFIIEFQEAPLAMFVTQAQNQQRLGEPDYLQDVTEQRDAIQDSQNSFLDSLSNRNIDYHLLHRYSYLFNGIAIEVNPQAIDQIHLDPGIKNIYPDVVFQTSLVDSVPLIGANQAWTMVDGNSEPLTGSGVEVAVLDTGIDYTHPDLGGCFGNGCKVAAGYDYINMDADPIDDYGHGTHVAGIIAANGVMKGVAPDATLHAYKVLDSSGSGYSSDLIAGINRAADPDQDPLTQDAVDVINMSLNAIFNYSVTGAEITAINNAVDLGVVVVVAAGNFGPDYQMVFSPATAEKAFVVGASDKSDQIAPFSSRGGIFQYPQRFVPDILAPGVSITSTILGGGYEAHDGTSMATPHIAGSAALVKQLHPAWSPALIEANLMNTAVDLGYNLYEQGVGRVQVDSALQAKAVLYPAGVHFGEMALRHPTWVQTTTLTIQNTSAIALDYDLSTQNSFTSGILTSLAPSSVHLEPGNAAEILLTLTVTPSDVPIEPAGFKGVVQAESAYDTLSSHFTFWIPGIFELGDNTLPNGSKSLRLGDLDNDGDSDLVYFNQTSPSSNVWLNDGAGHFTMKPGVEMGSFAQDGDLGDLDNDGDLDVVVVGLTTNAIHFNNGDGTFTPGDTYNGSYNQVVKIADLNGDEWLDFATGTGVTDNNEIWINQGDGTFVKQMVTPYDAVTNDIAIGDLDGDLDNDLVSANEYTDKVSFNDGNGNFTEQTLKAIHSTGVELDDLDGDLDPDIYMLHFEPTDASSIWFNDGNGNFTEQNDGFLDFPYITKDIALGDLDGDGDLDAFIASEYSFGNPFLGFDKVRLNDGTGTFSDSGQVMMIDTYGDSLQVDLADLDWDGDLDAVVTDDNKNAQDEIWMNRTNIPVVGRIRVEPSRTDAPWQVIGPKSLAGTGGLKATNLPGGTYTVTWGTIAGCPTPAPEAQTLASDGLIDFVGDYQCLPSAPKPISPIAESLTDPTPSFTWNTVAGSNSYQIQIDDEMTFTTPVTDQSVPSTSFDQVVPLTPGNYYWRLSSSNGFGSSLWSTPIPFTVITPSTYPFYDGFETGTLGSNWNIKSTQDGRVRVLNSSSAFDGSYQLILDDAVTDNTYSYASVTLMIDLSTAFNAVLSSFNKSFALGTENGWYISDDYGLSWYKLASLERVSNIFRYESIKLDQAALDLGITLNDHVLLKAQFYGDDAYSTDGIILDEVNVGPYLGAPTNLQANPASTSSMELNWEAPLYDYDETIIERNNVLLDDRPVGELTTFTDTGLNCSSQYTYRVIARQGHQYSQPSSSTTGTTIVCAPNLIWPDGDDWLTNEYLNLEWSEVSYSTHYFFQIDDEDSFVTPLISDTLHLPPYVVTEALTPGQVYYWRVQGMNMDGSGSWSVSDPFYLINETTTASFPFYDGFEEDTPQAGWYPILANGAKIYTYFTEYAGERHLAITDGNVLNEYGSDADAVLRIDLSGQTDAVLNFWWRESRSGGYTQSKVLISDDDGSTWHEVFDLEGSTSYENGLVHLGQAAQELGLNLHDHFLIRFHFEDDMSNTGFGIYLDEVIITESVKPFNIFLPLMTR